MSTARRALADLGHGIADRERQVEGRKLELHTAGFDFRQVNNIVDQREIDAGRKHEYPPGIRPVLDSVRCEQRPRLPLTSSTDSSTRQAPDRFPV
jgi:hypothetical protein